VRALLVPLGLGAALAATVGLAWLVVRAPGASAPPSPSDGDVPAAGTDAPPPPPKRLRPYQTTRTLTEDLRDALAADRPAGLGDEVRRVSAALRRRAGWMLENVAPYEANPRVRALLVLATGVHRPDGPRLLSFLDDRAPVVRRAAALAAGHAEDGAEVVELVPGVATPVGRALPDRTAAALRERLATERSEKVRPALERVLAGAG